MMHAPAWSPGDLASPSLRWSARGACELLCIAYTCPRRDGAGQITLVNYDLLLTSPLRFHSGPGASFHFWDPLPLLELRFWQFPDAWGYTPNCEKDGDGDGDGDDDGDGLLFLQNLNSTSSWSWTDNSAWALSSGTVVCPVPTGNTNTGMMMIMMMVMMIYILW